MLLTRGDYDRTISLLKPYDSDTLPDSDERGFEWHYLWNNSQRLRKEPMRRHWVPIISTAISPDDKRVVCGMWDGEMALHDLTTGRQVWRRTESQEGEHSHLVTDIAFSPEGQFIASGSVDRKFILRDSTSGEILTLQRTPYPVQSLSIAPSGRLLVVTMAERIPTEKNASVTSLPKALIHVYALKEDENGKVQPDQLTLQKELEGYGASFCRISPDGLRLGAICRNRSAMGSRIILWNTQDWSVVAELSTANEIVREIAFVPGRPETLLGVTGVFQPDGFGGNIRTWDIVDAKATHVIPGHVGAVNSIAVSRDGNLFVTGSDDRCIRLWRMDGFELLKTIRGHRNKVTHVNISSNGSVVVSASRDNTVKKWQIDLEHRSNLAQYTELELMTLRSHLMDDGSQLPEATEESRYARQRRSVSCGVVVSM